ncbi:hypothetical protein EJB05_24589 [Eragrostis curvula]|uniref:non-specific serine/threonine protein kinase n=1 Tax=Eragrostis curvula TaxID=38414 RepID=A0A5J9VBG9_9POAL|nr:hypothetical protein EJB05_24589 [Eragrostis curvula]
MGVVEIIGKYRLGRTIGEGTFAKVKLATDIDVGATVAVKVINKEMVIKNNLMYQVKREISVMKLLNHPNIAKIHEVIATKTKICLVMEYVSGGQLSDKLSYLKRLYEREAKKYFYQLIDALDYCHRRGVYHRDLKPENLLLDNQGNLKVSDFGLSVLTKPGQLLSTSCGSPCYIAPERAKINEIIDDKWFGEDYNPSMQIDNESHGSSDFGEVREAEELKAGRKQFVNAFQLIATCSYLDLSGLFHEQSFTDDQQKTKLSSAHPVQETVEKIKFAAQNVSLSVWRMDSSVVKFQHSILLAKCTSDLTLLAEVIEVTPAHCIVEVSRSTGGLKAYEEVGSSHAAVSVQFSLSLIRQDAEITDEQCNT